MTIPEITESEPLLSFGREPDGQTFGVLINAGETAVRLARANSWSEVIPLVVIALDGSMVALDDVLVSAVSFSGQNTADIRFNAGAVRFV
jgi:hypothetical protein